MELSAASLTRVAASFTWQTERPESFLDRRQVRVQVKCALFQRGTQSAGDAAVGSAPHRIRKISEVATPCVTRVPAVISRVSGCSCVVYIPAATTSSGI